MTLQAQVPGQAATLTSFVGGPAVTIVRPNNVNAYAAGQVFGTAADGRMSFAVPALPADAYSTTFLDMCFFVTQSRGATDSAVALSLFLFAGLPATVLGDQAAFALSDADIALIFTPAGGTFGAAITPLATANQAGLMNMGAGVNGRRSYAFGIGQASGNLPAYPASSIVGAYLVMNAAYVPVALEQWTLRPFYRYQVRTTV